MMPFWCGVLNGVADFDEQLQPFLGRELLVVAVLRHRDTLH